LAFLLGQSLEAFGQWKALLHLLLACEEAPLRTLTALFVRALAAVRAQLQHCLSAGRFDVARCLPPACAGWFLCRALN
jgi:A1 cistron-splicing factor AAR2